MQIQEIQSYITSQQPINEMIMGHVNDPSITARVSKGFLINTYPLLKELYKQLQEGFLPPLSERTTQITLETQASLSSYLGLVREIKKIYEEIALKFSGITGSQEKSNMTRLELQIAPQNIFHSSMPLFLQKMLQWQLVEETQNMITILHEIKWSCPFLDLLGAYALDYTDPKEVNQINKSISDWLDQSQQFLSKVVQLDLSINKRATLTSFPAKILSKLTGLSKLNLSSHQVAALPACIGNLTELRELNLYGNKLKKLPKEIANLTKLYCLCLSKNPLETLQDEIWQLTALTKLYIGAIGLQELPSSIGKLSNLKEIIMGSNLLTTLPKELVDLKFLRELYIVNNPFTNFPKELTQMTLETLSQDGNSVIFWCKRIVSDEPYLTTMDYDA